MRVVNTNSLAGTLDALNDVLFFGRSLSRRDGEEAARWIAGRQGLAGSYADMFAPTESDLWGGVRVFTGEKVRSSAGMSHILGEEACRALIILGSSSAGVEGALSRARLGMMGRLLKSEDPGMYCCGKCSVALWRHLTVGGLDDAEGRLAAGMKTLKSYRGGAGRWRRFPFYYTLLALSEIHVPAAVSEMRYAAPVCERYLKRSPKEGMIDQRRRLLAERVLGRC